MLCRLLPGLTGWSWCSGWAPEEHLSTGSSCCVGLSAGSQQEQVPDKAQEPSEACTSWRSYFRSGGAPAGFPERWRAPSAGQWYCCNSREACLVCRRVGKFLQGGWPVGLQGVKATDESELPGQIRSLTCRLPCKIVKMGHHQKTKGEPKRGD